MNDWAIGKFLKVVLVIHIAMCGAICLDVVGLQIPLIRPLIGFIYLTFVPGILILRIIRLHKISNIETLLYAVGLSLATLMFTGFFMNMIYPSCGISGPISLTPLIITISAVVLVLCVLCYARDKDFADPSFVDLEEVLSPPVLFLCLIPFMSILGTYLVNFHHSNILLMVMIVVIALVALLIGFDKFIPVKLYPLAIWLMAISLIYHDTLISMYLNRYDVIGEYYFSKLVVIGSYWDWTIPSNYNAMLSITMLAPIFNHICNLDLTWVFKIVYPLLFSLVPLGLYSIFKKMTDKKIAFLSSFYFMALSSFYSIVPSYGKQSIAEVFFVLLLMLTFDGNMDKLKKSFLLIVFSVSLVVSHYGISYLFMFSLIFLFSFLFLIENQTMNNLWEKIYFKVRKKEWTLYTSVQRKKISLTIASLFITFALAWYIYISSSSILNTIVHMGNHITNTLFTEFLSPEHSRGAHSLANIPLSPIGWVSKTINLGAIFFICIGLLKSVLKHKEMKFEKEYIGFSLYWFIICISAIAVSGFAVMNPGRLYHLSLFLLAPLAVIGGIAIFEVITKILKRSWTNKSIKKSLNILYVFFIISLLFSTDFISEITKDHRSSISLSQESIKEEGHSRDYISIFVNLMHEQNVFSARWLSKNREKGLRISTIKGNYEGAHALLTYGMVPPSSNVHSLTNTTREIREGTYIYLTYLTVVEGITVGYNSELGSPTFLNITNIHPLLEDKNKIYTNGGSEILWN